MLFGIVALLGVLVFEYRMGAISTFGIEVMVPYMTFVLVMTLLAIRFSHWYLPATGIFEAVALPLLLPTAAAAVSGFAYSLVIIFLNDAPSGKSTSLSEIFGFGIYAGMVFLYASGLALFPAAALASALLRRQFSGAAKDAAV